MSKKKRSFTEIKKEAILKKQERMQPALAKSHQALAAEKDKKTNIKVSAIVSTYNSEKFTRCCLEDLVNQTLYQKGKLEIVVVNSGSEQNEEAIVKEFKEKYSNIQYIKTKERETIYAAWNRGIKAARGQYITNANTDDRHCKDAFEKMSSILDQNPDIGLVYADTIITASENETFENHTPIGVFRWMDYSSVGDIPK